MKLLDTKHNWLLKIFHKTSYWLWKDILSAIGSNNIAIFYYLSYTTRFAFTFNGWCYNLFARFSWESYL